MSLKVFQNKDDDEEYLVMYPGSPKLYIFRANEEEYEEYRQRLEAEEIMERKAKSA